MISKSQKQSNDIELPTINTEETPYIKPINDEFDIEKSETDPLNVIKITESERNEEFELSFCRFWRKKWRQFTSILPGLLLLFPLGAHNAFTIYELDHFNEPISNGMKPLLYITQIYKNESVYWPFNHNASYRYVDYDLVPPLYNYQSLYVILIWFIGAIAGSMIATAFVRHIKKRTIYVSFDRNIVLRHLRYFLIVSFDFST